MKTKAAKPNTRKPAKHLWLKSRAPRMRTRTFKDGRAVILDQNDGIIGVIEARTPYRVEKRAEARALANRHP